MKLTPEIPTSEQIDLLLRKRYHASIVLAELEGIPIVKTIEPKFECNPGDTFVIHDELTPIETINSLKKQYETNTRDTASFTAI